MVESVMTDDSISSYSSIEEYKDEQELIHTKIQSLSNSRKNVEPPDVSNKNFYSKKNDPFVIDYPTRQKDTKSLNFNENLADNSEIKARTVSKEDHMKHVTTSHTEPMALIGDVSTYRKDSQHEQDLDHLNEKSYLTNSKVNFTTNNSLFSQSKDFITSTLNIEEDHKQKKLRKTCPLMLILRVTKRVCREVQEELDYKGRSEFKVFLDMYNNEVSNEFKLYSRMANQYLDIVNEGKEIGKSLGRRPRVTCKGAD